MAVHITRRVLLALPTLWLVLTLVFVGFRLLPGDAAETLIAQAAPGGTTRLTAQDLQRLRHRLGLDRPLLVQYSDFLSHAVRLDFGRSFVTQRPVAQEIGECLPYSAALAVSALLLAV